MTRAHTCRSLLLATALLAAPIEAQTVIDTRGGPGVCCGLAVSPFVSSYGQSFTIQQSGLTIVDFSFLVYASGLFSPDYVFTAVLTELRADGTLGSTLYQSAPVTASFSSGLHPVRFTTGLQSALAPGRYLARLDGIFGRPYIPFTSIDTYAGGEILTPSGFGANDPWIHQPFFQGRDTGFLATLTPATVAPEPATAVLLGTGLASLVGAHVRRRRRGTT